MIRFGVSGLPADGVDDAAFLDTLVERGDEAYELAFVKDFPWKERRCASFGVAAADRDIRLSIHAPYFAVLTVADEDRATRCRAALEHTVKLGAEMGARVVVAHLGSTHDEPPATLLDRIRRHLDWVGDKVGQLGVTVGLETAGKSSAFGSLGDIALLASEYSFVRPVVDWAHVHAMSGGGLTTEEAFAAVIAFMRAHFPGWMLDPLHSQFTDNEFGDSGEIRHVPYGQGTLRVAPLVAAARAADLRMTVISEAKDDESHDAIRADLRSSLAAPAAAVGATDRRLASGTVVFPDSISVVRDGDRHVPLGLKQPLRLSNIDKVFFPETGYTKGDLIQYYASISSALLPHLRGRAIVMARFPDGATGDFFYEKQAPGHQPDWMPLAPIHSDHRGERIDFVTAEDVESLIWLASMGCIEIHPWLSRVERLEFPDSAIFDLDPAEGATWEQVCDVAELLRVLLGRIGLTGHVKTSGATGLHIYVPIEPAYPYGRVRRFVETVGRLLEAANPDNVTMEWDIPRRAGKVFVDHNQNVGGKTIASVYSVRPTPPASVSTPITWDEVGAVRPDDFTIETIWDRMARHGDLFAPVLEGGQRLEDAERSVGIED